MQTDWSWEISKREHNAVFCHDGDDDGNSNFTPVAVFAAFYARCGAYFYARAALPIPTGLLKDGTAAAAASCNPVV